jgi:hypothetical protein
MISLPPIFCRKDFNFAKALKALRLNPAPDFWNVDHPIAHHAPIVQQIAGGRKPIADMEGQQSFLASTFNLLLKFGIPPHVINVNSNTQGT